MLDACGDPRGMVAAFFSNRCTVTATSRVRSTARFFTCCTAALAAGSVTCMTQQAQRAMSDAVMSVRKAVKSVREGALRPTTFAPAQRSPESGPTYVDVGEQGEELLLQVGHGPVDVALLRVLHAHLDVHVDVVDGRFQAPPERLHLHRRH